MINNKKNILIVMGRYLPGYKDGGPVRSIKNLVDYLGNEYNFKILTCDRDHGDIEPYKNILVNDWNKVGNAEVYYVPPKGFKLSIIKKLSNEVDLVYVCGCFNDYAINTLLLNRLRMIKKPVVIAAMGLFSPMEFNLKYKKKKFFTTVFNFLGMFKHIYWSATSTMEIEEIKKQIKAKDNFFIAEDLPRKVSNTSIIKHKNRGELNIVWISRIAPKKNLVKAIEILKSIRGKIKFTIYGPKHDEDYWSKCEEKLRELPSNIKWEWKGNLESEGVVNELKKYHVFLFPTLGENYGHVIQEALSAGCPCIISDQTPWKDFDSEGVGSVCSLSDEEKFIGSIEKYVAMDEKEFQKQVDNALFYAIRNSNSKAQESGYRKIFDKLTEER